MDLTKETDAITLAMAAAAAAYFRPNPFAQKRSEVAAYLALRQLLGERYPAVANDILDIGPASVERQNIVKNAIGAGRRRPGHGRLAPDPATAAIAHRTDTRRGNGRFRHRRGFTKGICHYYQTIGDT